MMPPLLDNVYEALADPELTDLCLLNARIKGVYHHNLAFIVHFSFLIFKLHFILYYLNIFCMFVSLYACIHMHEACTREVRTTFRSSFSSIVWIPGILNLGHLYLLSHLCLDRVTC